MNLWNHVSMNELISVPISKNTKLTAVKLGLEGTSGYLLVQPLVLEQGWLEQAA